MNELHAMPAWWTRRGFLKGGAAASAGAYGFSAYRGLAAVPDQFDGTNFQLAAPEPNPKRGGVLRVGLTNRPPHFDVHQSGTFNNLGTQGCMFDNLIRRDPRDSGKTIIPDLAHSWEIAKDGKTYTFFLRKDVQFHDGAEFTAEDVKATFDRIVKPPAGDQHPAQHPVQVGQRDQRARQVHCRVQAFRGRGRPTSSWRRLPAAGTLSCARRRWRTTTTICARSMLSPGTGPFRHVRRVENEVWVMEKKPDYWNKGLPYLDGLEFYNLMPFSPELGAAILANRVDYARVLGSGHDAQGQGHGGMTGTDFYQSVIQGTWVNDRKKPFDDPRVRRAMHLVIDRPVLVDVVKDVAPMLVGGFIYPFSEFATPPAELSKRLGYQTDPTAAIKEARELMAAAGYAKGIKGLDFLVRDVTSFKLWSQAMQAMLQETLNVECNLRTVVECGLVRRHCDRNFDLAIGAIVSTLLDPSDYFNAWYRKEDRRTIRSGAMPGSMPWRIRSTGSSMLRSARS